MKIYTEQDVENIIDEILEHADCVMDALQNEQTDWYGESLLNLVKDRFGINGKDSHKKTFVAGFKAAKSICKQDGEEDKQSIPLTAAENISIGIELAAYINNHPEETRNWI